MPHLTPSSCLKRSAVILIAVLLPRPVYSVTLTPNGLNSAAIVVSDNAHERVQFAARDLRHHLAKMTAADVAIGPERSKGFNFILEEIGELPQRPAGFTDEDAWDGSFRLSVTGGDVRITGGSPEGTANGVYEVLDRLGCRWYWPGDSGAHVPRKSTLELAEGQWHIRPSFPGRQGLKARPAPL